MLGYPPRPTSILPKEVDPKEWILQPKYRGWRAIIHNNEVFTRKGNRLPISTNYPQHFEYQLDGEILSTKQPQTEHTVRTAMKDGTWKIQIFDIFAKKYPKMPLEQRLMMLREEFGIYVKSIPFKGPKEIFHILWLLQRDGYEGLVLKKRNGVYRISQLCEVVDPTWVKIK